MATLGVMLVVLGTALLVAEAHVPTHGVLGAGAATAITAGVVLTLSAAGAAAAAVVAAGVAVALVSLVTISLLALKSLRVRRLLVRTGRQAFPGRVATVRTAPAPIGQVQLDGTLWRARLWELEDGGEPLAEGSPVVVESIEGLTLTVRPAEKWEVLR